MSNIFCIKYFYFTRVNYFYLHIEKNTPDGCPVCLDSDAYSAQNMDLISCAGMPKLSVTFLQVQYPS